MSALSRRTLIRSSLVAAFAGCLPELWAQPVAPDPAAARVAAGAGARIQFIPEFLDELKLSRAYTLECAHAMPPEKYEFRPVPEVRTFGQQMVHISEAVPGLYELFIEGKKTPTHPFSEGGKEPVLTKEEIIARLGVGFDYVERAAGKLNPSALRQTTKIFGGKVISKHRMLRFLLDHTTHHRGQTVVYLRINGIQPPLYRA
ncbi:MAG TPA: DinB family protein [Terriglobales bacterium]|nr:DinB family protein [Terriglobales bacterium]